MPLPLVFPWAHILLHTVNDPDIIIGIAEIFFGPQTEPIPVFIYNTKAFTRPHALSFEG